MAQKKTAVVSMTTFDTTYTAYSSEGQLACNNATSDDKCVLHCDEPEGKNAFEYSFDCGDAGECQFNCEESKCFENGILTASNSNNLNVSSSGSECLKAATIYLPNYGNAKFSMSEQKSFKEMTIISGTNTQHIIIDCTYGNGDECKQMQILAQTAQYLEINVGFQSDLDGKDANNEVIINCPINSSYSAPAVASCIINLSDGGLLKNAQINTINGIPADVWIYTGNVELSNVEITCKQGVSVNSGNSFNQSSCWNINSATKSPTKSPTKYPTKSPTKYPTKSPTKFPTKSPTNNPIKSSTKYPSMFPTKFPSENPTTLPIAPAPTYSNSISTSSVFASMTGIHTLLSTIAAVNVVNTTLAFASGPVGHISTTLTLLDDIPSNADSNAFDVILIIIVLVVAFVVFVGVCILFTKYGKFKSLQIAKPGDLQYDNIVNRETKQLFNEFDEIIDEMNLDLDIMPSNPPKILHINTSGEDFAVNDCNGDVAIDDIENIENHELEIESATNVNGEKMNKKLRKYGEEEHSNQINGDDEVVPIINHLHKTA